MKFGFSTTGINTSIPDNTINNPNFTAFYDELNDIIIQYYIKILVNKFDGKKIQNIYPIPDEFMETFRQKYGDQTINLQQLTSKLVK